MEDMARGHRWLFERREKDGTHRYYLRARVPQDLVEVIGKREVKKSLGTSDRREALERIDLHAAEVNETFAAARRQLEATPLRDLTEDEARRMVFAWFCRHDASAADMAFAATGEDRAEMADDAAEEAAAFVRGQGSFDVESEVRAIADSVLLEGGFPAVPAPEPPGPIKPATKAMIPDVDRESPAYASLCDLVRRAVAEAARRQVQRLHGQAASTMDPLFGPEVVETAARGPKLSEVLEMWVADTEPTARTAREWGIAERRFRELHGDLPVGAIEAWHVREFRETLRKVPAVQAGEMRKLPLPKLVAAAEGNGANTLSRPAVAKQLAAIKSLLSWCVDQGHTKTNAAAGVTVKKDKEAKVATTRRLAFDADDLRAIFEGTERYKEGHPAKFWLPRLAAYTGARLDELGQLTTDDVRRKDGIDYVSINADGEGKSLKTASSVRDVPLHPALVDCGFLDHVSARRSAGGSRLFPDLKPDSLGKVTGNFSKWFTRHKRKLGIEDPRKVFHSFRHGFKQACRRAGMSEEVHDSLTGHSGGGVGRGYGDVPLETKAQAVTEISYGIDLQRPRRGG